MFLRQLGNGKKVFQKCILILKREEEGQVLSQLIVRHISKFQVSLVQTRGHSFEAQAWPCCQSDLTGLFLGPLCPSDEKGTQATKPTLGLAHSSFSVHFVFDGQTGKDCRRWEKKAYRRRWNTPVKPSAGLPLSTFPFEASFRRLAFFCMFSSGQSEEVRMAEWSGAAFRSQSTSVGVGSNPTSDMVFFSCPKLSKKFFPPVLQRCYGCSFDACRSTPVTACCVFLFLFSGEVTACCVFLFLFFSGEKGACPKYW